MGDSSEKTRADIVQEHYEDALGTYGEDAFKRISLVLLRDISDTLAMMYDNNSSEEDLPK